MVISWWFHLNIMRNFGETRWFYGTFHGIIMGNGDFSWFNQRFDGDNTGNIHGETAWNWWYSPVIKRGKLHIPPKKMGEFQSQNHGGLSTAMTEKAGGLSESGEIFGHPSSITGWWWLEPWNFMTFQKQLGISSSQVTLSPSFFGVGSKPPTSQCFAGQPPPTTHEINEKPDLSPSFCGQNPWFPDGFPRQNGAHWRRCASVPSSVVRRSACSEASGAPSEKRVDSGRPWSGFGTSNITMEVPIQSRILL